MLRLVLPILSLVLPVQLTAQTVDIAPVPDWVETLDLPAESDAVRAEARDGVHFWLTDHQLRWEGETRISYFRTVSEVTDRAGLEETATFSEYFDPEFETLQLVHLSILRDGQRIDLTDKIKIEIFRRETRLEEGIIDGTLTAVAQIPDLRVGDILDRATVLTQRPYISGVGRSVSSILEWSVPVVHSRTLVHWPEGVPLVVADLPPEVSHSEAAPNGGTIRHEWHRDGFIPMPSEDGVPEEVIDFALLRISDQADWSALSAAMTPYYAADYPLPPEWEDYVASIAAEHDDPGDRAMAALRLVQDELHYVSLSVGAGGYFARKPEEVIASGFGDCKDKSLLLRVLLARLGIPATVALTDLDQGYGLAEEVPAPGVFDHMIVAIDLPGGPHWVDPTATHEGGNLDTRTRPAYGYALPLAGPEQRELAEMRAAPHELWDVDVREEFTFGFFGVTLEVETVHQTGSADSARARWATNPVSQISRDFLDYYSKRYPGLQASAPPEMSDDRAENRLVVKETYFLPSAALGKNGLREDFVFAPETMTRDIPDSLPGQRRLPLWVGWPGVHKHRVVVRGAPIDFEPEPDVSVKNPAFDFDYRSSAAVGGMMTLSWEMVTKARSVPPELAEQIVRDRQQVYDMTWFGWNLTDE